MSVTVCGEINVDGESVDDYRCFANEEMMQAKYRALVYRLASQHVGRCDLDDLLQAARLGLVQASRTYRNDKGASFFTHAYCQINFALHNHQRSNTGVIHIPYDLDHGLRGDQQPPRRTDMPCADTPGERFESDAEIKIVLRDAMDVLKRDEKEAVMLAYVDGHTHDEVGKILGIGHTQATRVIRRGLTKMARRLRPAFCTRGQ